MTRQQASRPVEAVSDAIGLAFGAVSWLRGERAVHPAGVTAHATVTIDADAPWPALARALTPSGTATVRLSKGAGLPGGLPDVLGVALSVGHGVGARFDVLLGGVRGARVLLTPGATWTARRYTTLLPYRVDGSFVWLAAEAPPSPRRPATATGDAVLGLRLTLLAAGVLGGWRRLGTLTVTEVLDEFVTFDPIVHDRPGVTPWPGWFSAVRRRVYARSRQGRHAVDRSYG